MSVGAGSIIALTGGAFFTEMVALGASGLANIPIWSMIAVIIPVIVGFILGNLDPDMKKFLGAGQHALIPFFAFALGSGRNFGNIISAGIPGVNIKFSCCCNYRFHRIFLKWYIWTKERCWSMYRKYCRKSTCYSSCNSCC